MYQGSGAFVQAWYGFSTSELFLRLDPAIGADLRGELAILFSRERRPGGQPWTRSPGAHEEKRLRMPLLLGGGEGPLLDERGGRCSTWRRRSSVKLSMS